MPDDTMLGNLLAQALMPAPGYGPTPPPQWTMPSLSIDTRGLGAPRFGAGYNMPFAGGEVGIEGGYQPQQGAPPAWDARLNYRRQF